MYTNGMFTSMTDLALQNQRSRIVIDWSDLCTDDRSDTGGTEVDEMLQWVHTYPRRSDIHVYLQSPKRTEAGRRLKNTLQALGCTVTVKLASSVRQRALEGTRAALSLPSPAFLNDFVGACA